MRRALPGHGCVGTKCACQIAIEHQSNETMLRVGWMDYLHRVGLRLALASSTEGAREQYISIVISLVWDDMPLTCGARANVIQHAVPSTERRDAGQTVRHE